MIRLIIDWVLRELNPIQAIRRDAFAKHVEGFFANWDMDECRAKINGYSVWIHRGFSEFADNGREDVKPLLSGLTTWERKILWRELKKEQRRRAFLFIDGWREAKQKKTA